MSVLILAEEIDPSADLMVRTLGDRGERALRIDTAWFPSRVSVDARLDDDGEWDGWLRCPHGSMRLRDVRAVWYRSPAAFAFPDNLTPAERWHASIEAKLGLGGVLLALPARWVNRPDKAATACYKPIQLAAAARVGLRVPDTLITNTAAAASDFAIRRLSRPGVVTKMLGSNSIVERGRRAVAFTRRVAAADLDDLAGIETTTHLFQAQVTPKAYDVRVVVVGSKLFAFAIHGATEGARLDFRTDYGALSYRRIDIPMQVEDGIHQLMGILGLLYAAIDFVVDHDGRWIFIGDVNPGGQYGWLEAATGTPLTAALADLLTFRDTP